MKEAIIAIATGLCIIGLPNVLNADVVGMDSGGGSVVVCFDKNPEVAEKLYVKNAEGRPINSIIPTEEFSKITRVVSFDLYEAEEAIRRNQKIKIVPIETNESFEEYINRLLQRFEKVLPYFSEAIEGARKEIPFEKVIAHNYGLIPVNDFAPIGMIDRKHCVFSSFFVQERLQNLHYLHVDSRLDDLPETLHSRLSKAVALLHEYVYWHFRAQQGHLLSDITRKVVQTLIIYDPDQTYGQFQVLLEKLGFDNPKSSPPFYYQRVFSKLAHSMYEIYHQERTFKENELLKSVENFFKENSNVVMKETATYPVPFLHYDSYFEKYQTYLASGDREKAVDYLLTLFISAEHHLDYVEKNPQPKRQLEEWIKVFSERSELKKEFQKWKKIVSEISGKRFLPEIDNDKALQELVVTKATLLFEQEMSGLPGLSQEEKEELKTIFLRGLTSKDRPLVVDVAFAKTKQWGLDTVRIFTPHYSIINKNGIREDAAAKALPLFPLKESIPYPTRNKEREKE